MSSPGSSAIVVLDFSGNVVSTITGEAGADAMALTGSTLYVALTTAGAIHKIDTGTLMDTGTVATGLVHPNDLVLANSKLWTTTGNCGSWSTQLVGIDPSTSPATVTIYPNGTNAFNSNNGLAYCAAFASNPTSNPNLLLGWDLGLSPAQITSFDVSSGSPVQTATAFENALGNLQDVAVNPDGAHFITASGAPYEFDEWTLSTLAQDGVVYPANAYPTAIATSAGQGGVMGGGLNGSYAYDFFAYQIGQPAAPLTQMAFSGANNTVPSRGVAISPDGMNAFVISNGTGSQVILNIVPIPSVTAPRPPTGVTASPGIDSATVSWTAPANQGASPVTGYTVTSSPGGITVQTASTSTTVSGLTAGVSYTFTVTATNAQGTSSPSAPSNAVTPWCCGPPTNVQATPGDSDAFITWTAPLQTGPSPLSGYQITPYVGSAAQTASSVVGSPPPTSALVTGLTDNTTYTFVVAAISGSATGQPSTPSNAITPIQGGNYHPLVPARILDTRDGTGGVPRAPVGPHGFLQVQITGRGGVPSSGVSAVVLNVTVTGTTAASYLTVYPTGVAQPNASNLNWVAGQTVPNLVEVAVGINGTVTVYNSAGNTNVIFDVAGWVGNATNSMSKDGLYNPVVPNRVLDTRNGTGGVARAPVGAKQTISIQVTGTPNIPATGVEAVVLNVTVTGGTAPSYLTVFPTGTTQPLASNLNFVAGQTVPNRVIVKLGTNPATNTFGWVSFFNSAGSVNVIADIGGWFTDSTSGAGGARFSGVAPERLFDSRNPGFGPLGPANIGRLTVVDQNGNPVSGVSAVVINVTVTNTTAASYLTLWPDGTAQPLASDLNWVAGETVPNLVVVKLGTNSAFDIFNSAGSTDVVIDLVGYYGTPQPAPPRQFRSSFRYSPLHPSFRYSLLSR